MATTPTTPPINPTDPNGLLATPTAPAAPTAPAVNAPNALNTSSQMPWQQPSTVPTATPQLLSDAVNRVADPNSLISQRARAVANEQSNSAGLLNSSMAIGAAQNAVLNQAVPIAQGNVNAQNQSTMAQLDQANKVQLAGVNASYQNVLNTNNNASTLYNNSMQQISQIQNNANMDATTKTAAINDIMNQLQSGLSMYSGVSNTNLSKGLNFAAPAATELGGNTASANAAQIKQLQDQIAQPQANNPQTSDYGGGSG
jgi:hypothetical protein